MPNEIVKLKMLPKFAIFFGIWNPKYVFFVWIILAGQFHRNINLYNFWRVTFYDDALLLSYNIFMSVLDSSTKSSCCWPLVFVWCCSWSSWSTRSDPSLWRQNWRPSGFSGMSKHSQEKQPRSRLDCNE